jgi:predicted nucleic acid-binding protein
MRTVVLDNEAVGALRDPVHRKHRTVLAHLAGVLTRRRKGAATTVVVPTAVRVEAGWDRTAPPAAAINRLRITDAALDSGAADVAAQILTHTGDSVADAHIGAVVRSLAGAGADIVVLTSDPHDITRAAAPVFVVPVRI